MSLPTLAPVLGGLFGFASIATTAYLIIQHQRNFHCYNQQKKIIGILWMIPIYSIDSIVGLVSPSTGLYVNSLRDVYESYAIYLFLSLQLSYLSDDEDEDDFSVVTYLETGPNPTFPFPFRLVYPLPLPNGKQFIHFVKRAVLQYCIIKPCCTIFSLLFLRASTPFVMLIILNVSILYAVAALAAFYTALKPRLSPFQPIPKFLAIKAILFLTFWQQTILAILCDLNIIAPIYAKNKVTSLYSSEQVAVLLQNLMVCIEMFVLSVAHLWIYPWRTYSAMTPDAGTYIGLAQWGDDYDNSSGSGSYADKESMNASRSGRNGISSGGRAGGRRSSAQTTGVKQSLLEEEEIVVFTKKGSTMQTPTAKQQTQQKSALDANFAITNAVADFNGSRLLGRVLLPSSFVPEQRGTQIRSARIGGGEVEDGNDSSSFIAASAASRAKPTFEGDEPSKMETSSNSVFQFLNQQNISGHTGANSAHDTLHINL